MADRSYNVVSYMETVQDIVNDLEYDNTKPEYRNRNLSLAITALENAYDKLRRIQDEQDAS